MLTEEQQNISETEDVQQAEIETSSETSNIEEQSSFKDKLFSKIRYIINWTLFYLSNHMHIIAFIYSLPIIIGIIVALYNAIPKEFIGIVSIVFSALTAPGLLIYLQEYKNRRNLRLEKAQPLYEELIKILIEFYTEDIETAQIEYIEFISQNVYLINMYFDQIIIDCLHTIKIELKKPNAKDSCKNWAEKIISIIRKDLSIKGTYILYNPPMNVNTNNADNDAEV